MNLSCDVRFTSWGNTTKQRTAVNSPNPSNDRQKHQLQMHFGLCTPNNIIIRSHSHDSITSPQMRGQFPTTRPAAALQHEAHASVSYNSWLRGSRNETRYQLERRACVQPACCKPRPSCHQSLPLRQSCVHSPGIQHRHLNDRIRALPTG